MLGTPCILMCFLFGGGRVTTESGKLLENCVVTSVCSANSFPRFCFYWNAEAIWQTLSQTLLVTLSLFKLSSLKIPFYGFYRMIEFWVPSDLGMPVPCCDWGIPNFSGTPEGQLSGQQGEILPPKAPQTQ